MLGQRAVYFAAKAISSLTLNKRSLSESRFECLRSLGDAGESVLVYISQSRNSSSRRATHEVLSSFVVVCALFSSPETAFHSQVSSKEAKIISRDSVFTNRSNPIDTCTVCLERLISSCDRSRSLRNNSSGDLHAAMANYFNGLFFDFIARPTEEIPPAEKSLLARQKYFNSLASRDRRVLAPGPQDRLRLGFKSDSGWLAAVTRVGKANNLQPIS